MAVYLEMYKVRNREQRKKLKGEFFGSREKIERFMDAEMEHTRGTDFHTRYVNQKMNLVDRFESDSAQVLRSTWVPSNFIRWLFFRMTWRVAESDTVEFVIGEPPLALAGTGIEHPDAEFFFPLSSNHVLHMSWAGNPAIIERVSIPRAAAQQANKVFISNSDRFVFFHEHCSKMARLIKKKSFHDNDIELNWAVTGVNPYRPKQPWQLTDEERDRLSDIICMHPSAPNFMHAWRKAKEYLVASDGGEITEWCKYCGVLKLKYDIDMEPDIRNSEVDLATGRWGTHQNWWVEWSKRNHQI